MIRSIAVAIVAAAALAIPSAASAKSCGTTTHGWSVRASHVTTCQFASATVNSLNAAQMRHTLYLGQTYAVWPYSVALGTRIRMDCYIASQYRALCAGGRGAWVLVTR